MSTLPNPKTLFPADYVDKNKLILENSRQNLFTPNPNGQCYYTTDIIVFGNKNICVYWQKSRVTPNYKNVLKSLEWIQKYIDYGTDLMNYDPTIISRKSYTGADGIIRKWIIEANVELCNGYGGASYNGYSWCAVSQNFYNYLVNTVNNAQPTIHQVIFYEMGRCMYDLILDKTLDWQMQDVSEYGYWTLGFNGAMTALAPPDIGCKMEYYGKNAADFRADRINDLNTYINNSKYTFDNTWSVKLLPWNNNQSINDLMSGLLIYLYDKIGYGYRGLQRVFYLLKDQPSTLKKTDRKGRAINFYNSVYQTMADLHNKSEAYKMYLYFRNTLKWNFVPAPQS